MQQINECTIYRTIFFYFEGKKLQKCDDVYKKIVQHCKEIYHTLAHLTANKMKQRTVK